MKRPNSMVGAGSVGAAIDIQKFVDALNAAGGPPMEQLSTADARAVLVGAQRSVAVDLPQ